MPQTDSIAELARFWDTHDLTDFGDQLEEVKGPVFKRQSVVQIPLPAKDLAALKRLAKSRGVRWSANGC